MTSKENIERLDNAIKEHLSEQCYMIWNSIKKDLEILEILKRNKLDLWDFKQDIVDFDESLYTKTAYEWYSMHYREFSLEMLSQEEFDLIKEWLENE